MKISQLIKELEKVKERYGDLTVEAKDEVGTAQVVYKECIVTYTSAVKGTHTVQFDL